MIAQCLPFTHLFQGEPDALLLSPHPFITTGTVVEDLLSLIPTSDVLYYQISPFTVWAALYALIDHPKFGPVHAFCTHTSANVGLVDVAEPNRLQALELIQFANEKLSVNP